VIVTEEQARKILGPQTWCGAEFRNHQETVVCSGSNCMAWRWWKLDKKYGYCGLAGVPQVNEPESDEQKP